MPSALYRWRRLPQAHRLALIKKLTLAASVVISLVVLSLILAPLTIEFAVLGRSPAARVNGNEISLKEYAQARDFVRYRAIRDLNALASYQKTLGSDQQILTLSIQTAIEKRRTDLLSVDFQIIENLLIGRLLAEQAEIEGYVISDTDINKEQQRLLTSTNILPLTESPRQAEAISLPPSVQIHEMVDSLGLDPKIFDRIVRGSVLRDYYIQKTKDEVPQQILQIHLQQMIAPNQAAADAVISRLSTGEDWVDLARELSTPQRDQVDGGDLGFMPIGLIDSRFADTIQTIEIGEISAPLQIDGEFYILRVVDRKDNLLVSSAQRRALETKAEASYKAALFGGAQIEYLLNSDKVDWATRHGLHNIGDLDSSISNHPY